VLFVGFIVGGEAMVGSPGVACELTGLGALASRRGASPQENLPVAFRLLVALCGGDRIDHVPAEFGMVWQSWFGNFEDRLAARS